MFKRLGLLVAALVLLSGSVAHAQLQSTPIILTTLCTAISTGTCGTIHGPLTGKSVTIYIEASAGVNGGTVVIEEASADTFAGTWSQVTSVTTSVASVSTGVHVSGVFGALRVRISSNITGGTITGTSLVGQ